MFCITLYGGDDEAQQAYLAMTEQDQQQLLCEVFPDWYPSDSERLGQDKV
ncbi:MAG: hypothetical protein ACK557_18850 [Planctomycetota bacterium]|jgi:hypothetical protein